MPDSYIQIEYPCVGETYSEPEYGVYGYGTYPNSSVLAGQERRSFLNSFPTLEAAQAAYPSAQWAGEGISGFREVFIPDEAPEWFDPSILIMPDLSAVSDYELAIEFASSVIGMGLVSARGFAKRYADDVNRRRRNSEYVLTPQEFWNRIEAT
jgi:hypothetical protein